VGRFAVEAEGATTFGGSSSPTAHGIATGSATVATLLACYRITSLDRLGLDLCAAAMGGALFSRGADVSAEVSRNDAVAATGLRLRVEWLAVPGFGLAAHVEGFGMLVHDELAVDDAGTSQVVWQTPAVVGGAGLSVFALFP
jgi:hypothetical protein